MRLASLSRIVSQLSSRERSPQRRERRRFSRVESLEARLALDGATDDGSSGGGTTDPTLLTLVVSTTVDEADGDYGVGDLSLREAVILANAHQGNVEISLPAGVYELTIPRASLDYFAPYDPTKGGLLISNLSGGTRIVGQDAESTIIDGNGLDTVLSFAQGNNELVDITIRGGNATSISEDHLGRPILVGNGGGIHVGGALRIDSAIIEGNHATGFGGGIFVDEDNAPLVIANTIVRGNTATQGGGAWMDEDTHVTIEDSEFAHNFASDAGGGIYFRETVVAISTTAIHDNYAGASGGGIHVQAARFSMFDTQISDNEAGHQGGGLYISTEYPLTIADSTISANATGDGGQGGGMFVAYAESLTISESDITNNRAGTTSGEGGGIYVGNIFPDLETTNIWLADATIADNDAAHYGGGMFLDYKVVAALTDTTIRGNAANLGGGIFVEGQLDLSDSGISENAATGTGGGIFVAENGSLTLNESVIERNTAARSAGLWADEGELVITHSVFAFNVASEQGGGLGIKDMGADILNTTFEHNSAGARGGGIVAEGATLRIDASEFSDNSAIDGGGLYIERGSVQITESTVADNRAGEHGRGGGVFALNTILSLTNVAVTGNDAGLFNGSGGGIAAVAQLPAPPQYNRLTINGGTIADNVAAGHGGGVAVGADVQATFAGVTFERNEANLGGGGLYSDAAILDVAQTTFRENEAEFGGGLYVGAAARVERSNFSSNIGNRGGGAYFANDTTAELHIVRFEDNLAYTLGGGIHLAEDASLTIDAVDFIANTAGVGGGMRIEDDGVLAASDVRFEANVATSTGGAVATQDVARLSFEHATFVDNRAGMFGGALALDDGESLFEESEFRGNYAGQRGGAVYIEDDQQQASFSDVTIAENSVGDNGQGGGIYNYRGVLSLATVTVSRNSTGEGGAGGGLYFDGRASDENVSTIIGSTIEANSAATGGGIAVAGGVSVAVSDTEISGNTASVAGGGLITTNLSTPVPPEPSITLDNVRLVGNTAAFGAGLCNGNNQSLGLTNSLIAENTATQQGGGAINDGGYLGLESTEVRGNRVVSANGEDTPILGGGLLNQALAADATLFLLEATIADNSLAGQIPSESDDDYLLLGAGIANVADPGRSAIVNLAQSVVSGNLATIQGPLNAEPGSIAAKGGGIYTRGEASGNARIVLDQSTVADNRIILDAAALGADLYGSGGGIHAEGYSHLTSTNSTVSNNTVLANNDSGTDDTIAVGGGIAFIATPATSRMVLSQSTLSGNSISAINPGDGDAKTVASGGGLSMFNPDALVPVQGLAEVAFSTIAFNRSHVEINGNVPDGDDEPIAQEAIPAGIDGRTTQLSIFQSIVGANESVAVERGSGATTVNHAPARGISSLGFNLLVGQEATAWLGALAFNGGPTQTHALLPGSPAIDAGDPAFDPNVFTPPLSTDQRGQPRVVDGDGDGTPRIDIGSFEFSSTTALFGDLNGDGVVGLGDVMVLRRNLGATNASLAQGDLTGDGLVDHADIGALVSHFGNSMALAATPSAPAAVVVRAAARAEAGRATDRASADDGPAVREARRRALSAESVDRVLSGSQNETADADESSLGTRLRARRRGR